MSRVWCVASPLLGFDSAGLSLEADHTQRRNGRGVREEAEGRRGRRSLRLALRVSCRCSSSGHCSYLHDSADDCIASCHSWRMHHHSPQHNNTRRVRQGSERRGRERSKRGRHTKQRCKRQIVARSVISRIRPVKSGDSDAQAQATTTHKTTSGTQSRGQRFCRVRSGYMFANLQPFSGSGSASFREAERRASLSVVTSVWLPAGECCKVNRTVYTWTGGRRPRVRMLG